MGAPEGTRAVRLRPVGLSSDAWTRAKVRAARGGGSAARQLAVALARYVDDASFRGLVDAAEPVSPRRERNVRLDGDLWAAFSAAAPARRVYATADAALRLSMGDVDG